MVAYNAVETNICIGFVRNKQTGHSMNLVFSMSDKPISHKSDEKNILIFFFQLM